jgi:hypothetical protein
LAIDATDYLINDGHTDDFSNPSERKSVLRNCKNRLEKHHKKYPQIKKVLSEEEKTALVFE